MRNCIESGRDVTNGETVYNNLCINFAGMSNVVNSLFAIKKIVFEDKLVK